MNQQGPKPTVTCASAVPHPGSVQAAWGETVASAALCPDAALWRAAPYMSLAAVLITTVSKLELSDVRRQ